ncbi:FAD-binding protein, partial [Streptomyces sp. OspMP-M43]
MSQDSHAQNRAVSPAPTDPVPASPVPAEDDAAYDYDVLVVGSGFGGAVSALRLTEKGYRVGVLEAG